MVLGQYIMCCVVLLLVGLSGLVVVCGWFVGGGVWRFVVCVLLVPPRHRPVFVGVSVVYECIVLWVPLPERGVCVGLENLLVVIGVRWCGFFRVVKSVALPVLEGWCVDGGRSESDRARRALGMRGWGGGGRVVDGSRRRESVYMKKERRLIASLSRLLSQVIISLFI